MFEKLRQAALALASMRYRYWLYSLTLQLHRLTDGVVQAGSNDSLTEALCPKSRSHFAAAG